MTIDAYFDRNTGKVVSTEEVTTLCAELGANPVADFGLVVLYKGSGTRFTVGRECRHCGAPLGRIDPDECKWVILSECGECRSIY